MTTATRGRTPSLASEPIRAPRSLEVEIRPEGTAPESVVRAQYLAAIAETPPIKEARAYRYAKRAFDLFVSSVLLIALSPALLVVALLVWLDSSGPIFFIQHRMGQGGRLFRMYKFRTMIHGAKLFDLDGDSHKREHDRRVTRVGRWLRRLSVDELPQLLNVIKGDMSLVGPRPEIPEVALRYYAQWQFLRLAAPQGITGWWQVNGRSSRVMHEHTEDDVFYVENASFWFDLRILALTIRAVIRRNGAY